MTKDRTVAMLALALMFAAATFVIGYAIGTMERTPLMSERDLAPIFDAIGTSVARQPTAEPTPTPTLTFADTLPLCDDPDIDAGAICVPVVTADSHFATCDPNLVFARREFVVPCLKSEGMESNP